LCKREAKKTYFVCRFRVESFEFQFTADMANTMGVLGQVARLERRRKRRVRDGKQHRREELVGGDHAELETLIECWY